MPHRTAAGRHGPAHVALDRIAIAVTLVDDPGRIAFQNRAAQALIARRDGVRGAELLLVFIADPTAHCVLDKELLGSVYALTVAEVRLAEALLRGETLTEFAAAAKVKPSTARSQLLSVFRKTGTTRQALLIKLLMSLASPD